MKFQYKEMAYNSNAYATPVSVAVGGAVILTHPCKFHQ
jgi:hypothetical protein